VVPWQSGRSLVWDVTAVCPLADTYVASAAREARSVAELAAIFWSCSRLSFIQPIAVETLDPIIESTSDFFSLLAKKISHHSGDERETAFFVPARFRASMYSDSTACCYTIRLCLRTARSNGHFDNFLLIFFQTSRDP